MEISFKTNALGSLQQISPTQLLGRPFLFNVLVGIRVVQGKEDDAVGRAREELELDTWIEQTKDIVHIGTFREPSRQKLQFHFYFRSF